MTTPRFDTEGVFDDDYLHFFGEALAERTPAETGLIWRLLDLRPGLEVLDLACGHGRIANRLAQQGCVVTGLDYTASFLDRARAEAARLGVTVNYVQGDMRALPWLGRFDRVVSWFTAFGYFDDEENRLVLRQAAAALRPGGRLMIELNNYPVLMRTYLPSSVTAKDSGLVVDQHQFDPLTSRSAVERTIIRAGTVRRTTFFTRLFTFPEIRDWLLAAGFSQASGYGEDGAALSMDHRIAG